MLYPLGACRPASRICFKSSAGIGVPSKLGVALRSWIAWLNVFFNLFMILFLLFTNRMPVGPGKQGLARCSPYRPAETILKIALPVKRSPDALQSQPPAQ